MHLFTKNFFSTNFMLLGPSGQSSKFLTEIMEDKGTNPDAEVHFKPLFAMH